MPSGMRRPPATIVIPAWNGWSATRACLQSLRPTLGLRDQVVVVVDNGSTDATAKQLQQFPWAEVVTNPLDRGFARGCNDGAARARGDFVIFLHSDTLVHGRWLDALVGPMVDEPAVGATGPRSNMVSGPQQIDHAPYGSPAELRDFARSWAAEHRGQTSPTQHLVGFCLAVRRAAFEEIGGFDENYTASGDEDRDLCRRLANAGWRLLVAHESFVHQEGHRAFDGNGFEGNVEQEPGRERSQGPVPELDGRRPLVSACLIVKDEEANLRSCLESLRGFADEFVVYDTGSTDGTVALARGFGATVFEGYWDDDFARARNAALEHCHGDWVVWLDADETLVCEDLTALRSLLTRTEHGIDAWSVAIDNLVGAGVGSSYVHHASRIFRRNRCEWAGRLHEQLAKRGTHNGIRQALLEIARIRHTGYLDEVMQSRNKSERNVRVAEREVAEADGWDKAFSLTSLGRSYMNAGRFDEATARCVEALGLTDNAITRRLAMRTLVEISRVTGELDEAERWVRRLREASSTSVQADAAEAEVALRRGDYARALELLTRLGDYAVDEDGFEHTTAKLAKLRADALAGLGRVGESVDVLLSVLGEMGILDTHLGVLVERLQAQGRPLSELAGAMPHEQLPIFLAQIRQLRTDIADSVLDACFASTLPKTPVLAAAASMARQLPIDRALVWSARLRAAGHVEACPLRFISGDTTNPLIQRARAAATAIAAFSDPMSERSFALILASAADPERTQICHEASALSPALGRLLAAVPTDDAPMGSVSAKLSDRSGAKRRSIGSPAGGIATRAASILWAAPFLNHSGYGEEARGFLTGLSRRGYRVAARSTGDESLSFVAHLAETPDLADLLQRSLTTPERSPFAAVLHVPGYAVARVEGAAHTVARTMFETDRLPIDWVQNLNKVDEVWVPSTFNVETFRRAGVRVPLHVVPGGVDAGRFRPGLTPLSIPGIEGRVYLSVFEWSHRKAPDVLLKAWARAFPPDSPVSLVLRCFPRAQFDGDATAGLTALVDEQLASFGASRADVAPIVVMGEQLPASAMPRLMASADVFLGLSRGEGWGRPLLEAMSCGLAVIGTRWSGNLDFMDDDNSLLVDVDGLMPVGDQMDVAFYRGHRWAEPSVDHLVALLRRTATDDDLLKRLGSRARADVEARWQWHQITATVEERLEALQPELRRRSLTPSPGRPRVRWVGDIYADHSLATVSRELCSRLARDTALSFEAQTGERPPHPSDAARTLRHVSGAGAPRRPAPVDIEVRHQWPPDLSPTTAGALVLVQPWEFGGIPAEWTAAILEVVDEVWVPTTWVRDCYIKSGIPADRVAVVPNGVDTEVFRPEGPTLPLHDHSTVRLLFVGGTIDRKGFDLLLDAYLDTFSPDDDVCLVVKPFGGDSVYEHAAMDARLRACAANTGTAAIEIVDQRLTRAELGRLYRACHVLVHPYRGEGFGLPVAEAMACGLPTVVTGAGACLDFCDATTSWLVDSRTVAASVPGFEPGPAGFWLEEPDREHLRHLLLLAVRDDVGRKARGIAASHRIQTSFTWDQAAQTATGRLLALTEALHLNSAPPVRPAEHVLSQRACQPPAAPDRRRGASSLRRSIQDHSW